MNPADSDSGGAWVIMVAASFAVGFVLAKMKALNEANSTQFCTWTSGIVAALVALAADSPTAGAVASVFGRLGIFAIVWLVFGLVFTIGVSMGIEKAGK